MIYAVAATKGGVGKSTIATNLAVIEAAQGRRVLLVDTDLQGTSRDWSTTRSSAKREPAIDAVMITGAQTYDNIMRLADAYDTVVIDSGGRWSAELQLSIAAADLVAIPLRPSNADSWALPDTLDAIAKVKAKIKREIPAVAFCSCGSTRPRDKETDDLLGYLRTIQGISVLTQGTRDRKAYRDALAEGAGVVEIEPHSRAAEEIGGLHDAITALAAKNQVPAEKAARG